MSEKDYIRKHLLLGAVKTAAPKRSECNSAIEWLYGMTVYAKILDIIEAAKPADVAPVVHGRWIKVKHPYGNVNWYKKCSICDKCIDWQDYKYCPHCGAKMDESEEEK